ncbi:Sec-independent protein translocase subunit TatA [Undibacterium sp. LX40W]|uniref:Sec-independent protein translocase protein TatA n=1 Tax=Undibacterium nitidum TaxID=2762298 RepID=A0A923KUB4_9BURK|nr:MULTISPECIES: Sec-independent protein translocase subunit TatA [Undibacterium]MBC3882509.1 Sec-independent protein translocase subunit TatA [Undibacterium nitidum]MBC3892790.1 Sec-independent protein translocase subunit TatA [Undibacterium sp. LX40W]
MGSFSILHLIALLVVVVLVFGTKKLGNVGSDLGKAVKGFKDGLKGEEETAAKPNEQKTIDVEAKDKSTH